MASTMKEYLEKALSEVTIDYDIQVKRVLDNCINKIASLNTKTKGEKNLNKAILELFRDLEKAQSDFNRKVF